MDRATFEKIVGTNATITLNGVSVSHGVCNSTPGVWFSVGNKGSSAANLFPDITPFRLRRLLHGLGIKCDWDEPVTFERLMELDGAVSVDGGVLFHNDENEYYFGELAEGWHNNKIGIVTTMKQVHLLLEAAGVGR